MFMLFTHALARGIVVICVEIQGVNTANSAVNERVCQCAGEAIVTPDHEDWPASV